MSETHQVLRANGLRSKVRVQTDGGLKTGLDVIKAAILGAESFGFGTGPMIAMGCKYLRICHLNNCATGVATQHKILRFKHFKRAVSRVLISPLCLPLAPSRKMRHAIARSRETNLTIRACWQSKW